MGDRRSVEIIDGGESIFLYTHWMGEWLPKIVQDAISLKKHWDNGPHLARVILIEMLAAGNEDEPIGIWNQILDTDYPGKEVVVDCDIQHVKIGDRAWPFKDYAEANLGFAD